MRPSPVKPMKCPSCGYVAYQAAEECVNCGAAVPPSIGETDVLDDVDFRRTVRRKERDQLGFSFPGKPDEADDGDDLPTFTMAEAEASRSAFNFGARDDKTTADEPAPWETATGSAGDDSSFSSGTRWADETYAEENTWVELYSLASGFGRRMAAGLVDTVFFVILFAVLLFAIQGGEQTFDLGNPTFIPAYLFVLVLHGFYFTFFHAATGQTPGKMLAGIKVVAVRGGALLTPWDSFVRWLGYFLSALPLGAGFFWALLDHDDRCLHDKWAHSIVVRLDSALGETTAEETGATDGEPPAPAFE